MYCYLLIAFVIGAALVHFEYLHTLLFMLFRADVQAPTLPPHQQSGSGQPPLPSGQQQIGVNPVDTQVVQGQQGQVIYSQHAPVPQDQGQLHISGYPTPTTPASINPSSFSS